MEMWVETVTALFQGNLDLSPPFLVVAERTGAAIRIRVRRI
jgi:hypothetical protein